MNQPRKPSTDANSSSDRKPSGSKRGKSVHQEELFGMSETRFWIQRLSKTAIRAMHILGIAGSAGGFLYGVDKSLWIHWWIMAMVTGLIMTGLEIRQSRLWLIQLKGVLTYLKLGLLSCFFLIPQHKPELFIIILVMSVVIAHGPAGLRHYSIWHRRRIDEPKGKKRQING
ncbi:hypothetical protein LRP52_27610 [Photobacterium sp. ZSDE20]|uniref:Uncharacterized protein n=1 Tax=Photobacterium pectinilyticum TaxID=2906793 RepID=A0ABT1N6L2_9GAMM|nr:hypothetical protein [Photobacterium sp. ZSDE20]MCQ1059742.1 hypothetical protein [Photobacterium sp. ZSDE20]MDD1825948.1 hypothetical protein [Photobacterium sp. ZSDE20]